MAANPRTLVLEQAYADRLKTLAERTVALVANRYQAIDQDDLGGSFRRFLPAAAEMITLAQGTAQAATDGFVRALVRLETGRPWEAVPGDDTIPGTTIDGRRLEQALASVPPAVLVTIKQGRALPLAMARGLHVASRMAATETADAARRQIDHHLVTNPGLFEGWNWVVRGTCAACLAMMNNALRKPGPLNGHPGCTCIKSPQVAGVDNLYARPDGRARFDALSEAEQAALFRSAGRDKARALRAGRITLDDLVETQGSRQWRGMITEGPLPPKAIRRAQDQATAQRLVDLDLADLKNLEAAQKARAAAFLGGETGAAIQAAAERNVALAARSEAAVSQNMLYMERTLGGRLEGFEFRTKAVDSMARKISGDMLAEPGLTVAQAAAGVDDGIRYTLSWSPENYWRGVQGALDHLASQGIRVYVKDGKPKWKDFWDGDVYRGINAVFEDAQGVRFELQFHTTQSYAIKTEQHVLYEAWRLTADPVQQERVAAAMRKNWVGVNRPSGTVARP